MGTVLCASVVASKRWKLSQFNVKTVFLYVELTKEIYMAQPEGFSDEPTTF